MTAEDIAQLLSRLAIFPKPMPKTLDGAVKAIERQRWEHRVQENEACARVAEQHDASDIRPRFIAAAIRARVKP